MTNFALGYVIQQFFLRIWDFLFHWYVEGTRALWHRFLKIFFQWEQTFALRITLRHLFEPLYKDYTVVGQILGPVFRIGRTVMALAVYAFLLGAFLFILALWLVVPLFLLAETVHPFRF